VWRAAILRNVRVLFVSLSLSLALGACTSVPDADYHSSDPMEGFNRVTYNASDWVDRKTLAPLARGYSRITPNWWRTAIDNVFSNLLGVDSALNGFLQGKPKRGATDLTRVLVNSTLGIGGIFDVARRVGLQPGDEDLGQTFAVWGSKQTPFVNIPFLGPSSVRDLPSVAIRAMIPQLLLGDAFEPWIRGLRLINTRAQLLTLTDTRDAAALDPYLFTREAYYQRQKFRIFDGDPPEEDFFDDDFEEFDD
jgi:phospholipid-binding lipoprotein MlaA